MTVTLPAAVKPGSALTDVQRQQYQRQIVLPGFGEIAQRRLLAANVLVIGAGGLGTPVLQYLAAAGVGHIGVIDDDVVDVTNLHRQVLHSHARLGWPKTSSAVAVLQDLNPNITVTEHQERLNADNIERIMSGYDLVVDGADNFPTRYLVADACAARNIPEIWGTIFQYSAQVSVFWANPAPGIAGRGLRDLFPTPPTPGTVPSCSQAGVLGTFCGQVGSAMATEAIKVITGVGTPAFGEVMVMEALSARLTHVPFGARPAPDQAAATASNTAAAAAPNTAAGAANTPATSAHSPFDHDDRQVNAASLHKWLQDFPGQFQLWDLRDDNDWDGGVIPTALPLRLDDVLDGHIALPDQPVVLYCHTGARSYQIAAVLAERAERAGNSSTRFYSLEGGVEAWWAQPGNVTVALTPNPQTPGNENEPGNESATGNESVSSGAAK